MSAGDARRPPPANQLEATARARNFARDWFADLRRRVMDERQPYAMCSAEFPHEIFEALGMPVITTEWWSGVVAAKRRSADYLDWLNRQGFHDGLGVYQAVGLATLIATDVPDPPWGGLPPPAMICAPVRESAADRLYSMVAARCGATYVRIDVPAATRFYPRWWEMARWNWEELYETHRIDLMVEQYRAMIEVAEKAVGRKLERDRLAALLERVNLQESYFDEVRDLVCSAPKCPVRMAEQMHNTMTAQWHRGTDWAVDHARRFRDEVRERVDRGVAVCADERVRLMWMGAGLWQNTEFYNAFEDSHGAVFVRSMYMSIAADGYIKRGFKDPVRALAARYLNLGEQMHIPPWAGEWAVHEARRHRVRGAVTIVPSGMRHQIVGTIFQRLALEKAGIPVLELETDPNDSRTWNEAEMRGRVARFIEERLSP